MCKKLCDEHYKNDVEAVWKRRRPPSQKRPSSRIRMQSQSEESGWHDVDVRAPVLVDKPVGTSDISLAVNTLRIDCAVLFASNAQPSVCDSTRVVSFCNLQ